MSTIAEFFATLSLFYLFNFLIHAQLTFLTLIYGIIFALIIELFILFLKRKYTHLSSKYTVIHNEYNYILAAFNKANFGLGIIDLDGNLVRMNRKLAQTLGYKSNKAFFKEREIAIKFDEFTKNKNHIDHLVESKMKKYQTVIRCEKNNGENIWLSAYISFVTDKEGILKYYVMQTQKMATRIKSDITLNTESAYNQITGLLNSHGLEEALKSYLSKASANLTNLVYVCLGIGFLDNLKKVLNSDGITIFLQVVAQRLQNSVRNTDLLAHINEEQFIICFINTGSFNPKDFISRILEHLSSPLVIEGVEVIVTTHFGISLYPNDANDFATLSQHANLAYQYAKSAKIINNYEFYKPELLTTKSQ